MLILEVVPYTPPEPRPRAFAFLVLDDSPKFLNKDSESYWERLTTDAMNVYESIYEACADPETRLVSRKYQFPWIDETIAEASCSDKATVTPKSKFMTDYPQ